MIRSPISWASAIPGRRELRSEARAPSAIETTAIRAIHSTVPWPDRLRAHAAKLRRPLRLDARWLRLRSHQSVPEARARVAPMEGAVTSGGRGARFWVIAILAVIGVVFAAVNFQK